jgi:protein involved in polysaccharide export with SLBB domain
MTTSSYPRVRILAIACALTAVTTLGLATRSFAQDAARSYVLQRGDEISVKVFGEPELTDTVKIRPDGRVSLALLDDVKAADLTAEDLDKVLTERYAKFFRTPEVTVVVRTFANRMVYIGGEVGQPKAIELAGDLTALSAILQAGGFMKTARPESVVLLRNDGNNKPLIQTLDLKKALAQGNGDVKLQPFDVIFVPKSRIATVDQFVDQYMRQLIPITLTAGFTYLFGANAVTVR